MVALVLASFWAAPQLLPDSGWGLNELGQIAGIASLAVGVAALVVAVLAMRSTTPGSRSGEVASNASGTTSTLRGDVSGTAVLAERVEGGVNNTHITHYTVQQEPAATTALDGMPAPPGRLTGRGRELEELLTCLDPAVGPSSAASVVVLTLSGMGGAGKTALALKAAQTASGAGWFCRHLFVDLRGYAPGAQPLSAEAALDVLLRQMGVDPANIPPGVVERSSFYRSALQALSQADQRGRPVLVVADNANSVSQVWPLRPGAGGHRLVATSRGGLHSLPEARHLNLGVLESEAAVALLSSDLAAHTPGDPRADDQAGLNRLADLCGCLPLALEIAAAYLKRAPHLTPGRLADRLQNAASLVDKLTDPDRAAGQERVLRAVFDTSLTHLDPAPAQVFMLVATTPGPTISTDAAAVLTGLPAAEAQEALEELAAAHLLTHPAPGRWGVHDLLADYARTHPHPPTGRARALGRLLDHYTITADAADNHLRALPGQPVPDLFPDRATVLAWLDTERTTLVAAALAAPTFEHVRAAILLPLHLSQYLYRGRYFEDLEQVSRCAQATAQTTGNHTWEATAWNSLGGALTEMRRFKEAIEAHTRACELYQQVCDVHGEAMAWGNLGVVLAEVRRFKEAIEAHTRACELYQQVCDVHGEASAWNNLGSALTQVRLFEKAIEAHTRACELYQQVGDAHREASAWNNLGVALRQMQWFEGAIEAHTRARQIFHTAGDAHGEAMVWNNLGLVLRRVGQFAKAIEAHTRACELFQQVCDAHGEAQAWGGLSAALLKMSQRVEAVKAIQRAVNLFEATGDEHRAARSRELLARIQPDNDDLV
ncbi:tetratricopeptide repeat protein [Nocardiopsis sp. Huas11]|uniref:tetratricopeptide repeat protein n=1 Tax=Nocardiopsis sp. Huas11 TaxID=2183912 RepID=UPI001F16478F|nr:tetratricopeptide repeat protein [Nocardiopsis sp. Huas11]